MTGKARGDDSGLIDLGSLVRTMDATSPAPATAELVCNEEDVEDAEDAEDDPVAPDPPPRATLRPPRTRRRWLAAAVGVAALALLASAYLRWNPHAARASVVEARAPERPAKATEPTAPPAVAAATGPETLSLDALPSVSAIAPAPREPGARAAPSPTGPGAAVIAMTDLPANAGTAGDLGDAMRRATDAHTPAPVEIAAPPPAAAATLRPAAGALNAAIVSATRKARACLAADDPVVHATLTFAADGHASVRAGPVTSSLPGAQSCVTEALASASVAPFVEAPLVVPVSVRP